MAKITITIEDIESNGKPATKVERNFEPELPENPEDMSYAQFVACRMMEGIDNLFIQEAIKDFLESLKKDIDSFSDFKPFKGMSTGPNNCILLPLVSGNKGVICVCVFSGEKDKIKIPNQEEIDTVVNKIKGIYQKRPSVFKEIECRIVYCDESKMTQEERKEIQNFSLSLSQDMAKEIEKISEEIKTETIH